MADKGMVAKCTNYLMTRHHSFFLITINMTVGVKSEVDMIRIATIFIICITLIVGAVTYALVVNMSGSPVTKKITEGITNGISDSYRWTAEIFSDLQGDIHALNVDAAAEFQQKNHVDEVTQSSDIIYTYAQTISCNLADTACRDFIATMGHRPSTDMADAKFAGCHADHSNSTSQVKEIELTEESAARPTDAVQ